MKYHYEIRELSDDYLFPRGKPTKGQQVEALEDEGWEIFSINKYHTSTDWQVIVRKPRQEMNSDR